MLLKAGELPIVPKALKKSGKLSNGGPLAGWLAEKCNGGWVTGKKFVMDEPADRFVNGAANVGWLCPV